MLPQTYVRDRIFIRFPEFNESPTPFRKNSNNVAFNIPLLDANNHVKHKLFKQERIPVGCVPSTAVAVSLVDRNLDTRLWKHYLSATAVADGNKKIFFLHFKLQCISLTSCFLIINSSESSEVQMSPDQIDNEKPKYTFHLLNRKYRIMTSLGNLINRSAWSQD